MRPTKNYSGLWNGVFGGACLAAAMALVSARGWRAALSGIFAGIAVAVHPTYLLAAGVPAQPGGVALNRAEVDLGDRAVEILDLDGAVRCCVQRLVDLFGIDRCCKQQPGTY